MPSSTTPERETSPPRSKYDPGKLSDNINEHIGKQRRYKRSRLYTLKREYIEISNDLLVAERISDFTEAQKPFAESCKGYLIEARLNLESREPDVYFCSSMLDLAASNLVWLYTDDTVEFRSNAVLKELRELKDVYDVKRPLEGLEEAKDARSRQAVLADTLEYFSRQEQRLLLADNLQVSRLRKLLLYMGMALGCLIFAALFAVPFATTNAGQAAAGQTAAGQGITGWPVMHIGPVLVTQLIAVIAVGAVGAAGGVFSGFVKTRDSSTTLGEYRTSMLKLASKPLVGAVAAITLYILLDWQVTGVRVVNGGTFLLVGFLAGFSERYFLRLVQAPAEYNDQQNMQKQDQLASVRDQLVSIIAGNSLPPSNGEQQPPSNTGSNARTAPDGQPATVPNAENQFGEWQLTIKRQRSGAYAAWESLKSADGVSPDQPTG